MNCPKQPKIPIYIFVFGAFGMVKILQNLYDLWRTRRKDRFDQGDIVDDEEGGGASGAADGSSAFVDNAMSLFLLVWFGFGNYWVLPIYGKTNFIQPVENDSMNWCSKDAFMTAVYHIAAVYILAAGFLIIVLFIFIYSKLCRVRIAEEDTNNDAAVEA